MKVGNLDVNDAKESSFRPTIGQDDLRSISYEKRTRNFVYLKYLIIKSTYFFRNIYTNTNVEVT